MVSGIVAGKKCRDPATDPRIEIVSSLNGLSTNSSLVFRNDVHFASAPVITQFHAGRKFR
jgi:hypothetical protein